MQFRRPLVLLLCGSLSFLACFVALAETDLETRAKIEGYVKLLGADDAKTREDAEKALIALGEVARPFLEKALADASGEVRSRVRSALATLDDAVRSRTRAVQTWPGLRGGPTRSGVGSGEIPAKKPALVWSQEIFERSLLQGAVVPAGDYVACLSGEGVVRAFSSKDGARLWVSELPGAVLASAVLAADRLVVPTGKGLFALDTRDGQIVWKFDAAYGANAAPAVVGLRVYGAFKNLGVKAFDLRTGDEVFTKPMAPAGALLADGDLLVCGTEDGALVRLDPETGRERWKKNLGAPPNMGPTLAAPGIVVAFTKDRYLRAFEAEHGKEIWNQRMLAVSGSESLAAAAGRVFLTDQSGWITALDAATGRMLWHRNEGFTDMGGPCATATAVIDASRGRLTCRDADSGDWLWRLDERSSDNAAPAISGGRIYVLFDGMLRCFE